MPAAQNVVSTWIVLDDPANASVFPQMGRFTTSADPATQASYWRCVAVSFACVARADSSCRLRLYTPTAQNLQLAEPSVRRVLEDLSVEVVEVPLRHLPPSDFNDKWRNQFYILDILEEIATEKDEANHIIMDSDCVCLRPLGGVFAAIERWGALTLVTGERLGRDINGLTREQMQTLFADMGDCPVQSPPEYFGGEFFAADTPTIRSISALAERAWQLSLERHKTGQPRFMEEAHLLTYVYYQLGISAGTANAFIKRLWTGYHYRNGEPADKLLPIVHLPAEKRYGYNTLYQAVIDRSSWFYTAKSNEQWIATIQKIMSVPRPRIFRLASEFVLAATTRLKRLATPG